jgi:hypothetical protein
MGKLVRGEDAGGTRYFLDGKPVHNGAVIQLRMLGGAWMFVSLESVWREIVPGDRKTVFKGGYVGVLHFGVGHEWEQRFEVRASRLDIPDGCDCKYPGRDYENDENRCRQCGRLIRQHFVIYDRRRQTVVTMTERRQRDGDDYPVYQDLERDRFTGEWAARSMADSLQRCMEGGPGAEMEIPPEGEFRWPPDGREERELEEARREAEAVIRRMDAREVADFMRSRRDNRLADARRVA